MKKIIIIVIVLLVTGTVMYQSPFMARYLPTAFKVQADKVNPKIKTTLYVWQDKSGQKQITDAPPADGIPYEKLDYQQGELVSSTGSKTGKSPGNASTTSDQR